MLLLRRQNLPQALCAIAKVLSCDAAAMGSVGALGGPASGACAASSGSTALWRSVWARGYAALSQAVTDDDRAALSDVRNIGAL